MIELIFFIIFAVVAVVSALLVVTLRNPVHSAIFLISTFFQVAAIFVLLRSPFLAVVQVFIYVGAVMVIFLFAVMMLDLGKVRLKEYMHQQSVLVVPAMIIFFALAAYLVLGGELSSYIGPYTEEVLSKNTEVIGRLLYTKFIFPFEVVSVVLLVALVGAIVLIKKEKGEGGS